MTWLSLAYEAPGVLPAAPRTHLRPHVGLSAHLARTAIPTPLTRIAPSHQPPRVSAPLGTATIAGGWQWAGAVRVEPVAPAPKMAAIRISSTLLDEMAAAARTAGRSLSEVWAEAAHEWLTLHAREDEPQPPTPAAAALAVPRPARSWVGIDAVLADLRHAPASVPAA